MTSRLRSESGQAVLMTVLFLTVLLGAAALVTDVGAWYRQQRQAQATADAAALAGAQALPSDPAQAQVLAAQYATSNGGGVLPTGGITLRDDFAPHDTVVVKVSKDAPAFFANIFAIDHATVTATAAARAGVPEEVAGAAPIVVNKLHPLLSGPGCPCFEVPTTLPLGKDGAPGAFGFSNLQPDNNNGNPDLSDWIQSGFDGYLGLGNYDSDPGAKFDSNIDSALDGRLGTELLLPVYDSLSSNGSNAYYDVIGWVGFHLTSYATHGNTGDLSGWFTKVIWSGLLSNSDKHLPDFGVYSVELVN